jgi:hypothetical protein
LEHFPSVGGVAQVLLFAFLAAYAPGFMLTYLANTVGYQQHFWSIPLLRQARRSRKLSNYLEVTLEAEMG